MPLALMESAHSRLIRSSASQVPRLTHEENGKIFSRTRLEEKKGQVLILDTP